MKTLKRLCAHLLALSILLSLWGCTQQPGTHPTGTDVPNTTATPNTTVTPGTTGTPSTMPPTNNTNKPNSGTVEIPTTKPNTPQVTLPEEIPETIDYRQTVLDLVASQPEVPKYDGKILVPFDPEREFYISLANHDCDFYPDKDYNIDFQIITLKKYDVSEIQIDFDMQTEHSVSVLDVSNRGADTSKNSPYSTFDATHYLIHKRTDWYENAISNTYWGAASTLSDLYRDQLRSFEGINPDQMEPAQKKKYDLLRKHLDNYVELTNAYAKNTNAFVAEYESLTAADLPDFYIYSVGITFTGLGAYEETVDTATITLGDEVYTQNFGQWRLHKEQPQEMKDCVNARGMEWWDCFLSLVSRDEGPYTEGYIAPVTFRFKPKEDIAVLGVRQAESSVSQIDIKGARVQIMGKDTNGFEVVKMEYFWDGRHPLYFSAGDNVSIDICLQDDRFTTYEFCITPQFYLDYEVRNHQYSLFARDRIRRDEFNIWYTFSMLFEGIDIGEYHFYNPVNYWFWNLPEEWLERQQ